tara:strand:- start:179 stop:703 length:525 start_codon:yes stop_codon:yes gene_type:complete
MFKSTIKNEHIIEKLYSNILTLSRNKLFYNKIGLNDTFQNRIYLIFIHTSFLFIKLKKNDSKHLNAKFCQNMFDLIFKKIDLDMREIGFGDTIINKNMKSLIKNFYNILLNLENYVDKTINSKDDFFHKYLSQNINKNKINNGMLVKYFDKYHAFCFDLNEDSVLKGELKFKYN